MALDIAFGVLLIAAIVIGWRGGLIGRLGAWIGFAVGALAAARWTTDGVDALAIEGEYQRLAAGALAVLFAGVIGHATGWRLARGLRNLVPGPIRWIDSLAGTLVGVLTVALFVWIVVPPFSSARGWPQEQASESKVVEFVEQIAPLTPSGRGLLDRLLQDWPRVPTFGSTGLPVDVGEPPEELAVSAETLARVADSVLRVQAIACSQRQDGTAFVVSPGVALTNAHVVAGSQNIEIAAPGQPALPATVTAFDPERDLALVRVNPDISPLALESPQAGQLAAVVGHPSGGPLRTAPLRLVERAVDNGRDLYDSIDITRRFWFAAAHLQTGDSGAPVVDTQGAAVGVVFAVAPHSAADYKRAVYVLDRSEIDGFMAETAALGDRNVVSTGPCLK